ncbi:MAG: right-handed parallel beta-helix repeat-containing protein [Paludibacter sp.]|nr:right-handed parallel beta-helix repeat-containing protein [Paludibacter sp.]
MKFRFFVQLLFLSFSIAVVSAQKIVNLSDFNIVGSKDATPCVYEALKSVEGKDAKLVFPKGIYHFYPDKAFGKYHAITNHDNSYKYFAFPLINCKNIEIDGQGSEFIFHGVMTPVLVENSENITLKNFSIDWQEPFYLQAKVASVDTQNKTFDLFISNEIRHQIEGNRLSFSTNGLYIPFLGEHIVFDPKTKAVAYNSINYNLGSKNANRLIEVKAVEKNRCTVLNSSVKQLPKVGYIYVFKGPNGMNRFAPAMHLSSSKNLNLTNINIYQAGGMGLIAEKTENIHLNSFNVKLREGTNRILTTTADATHFCNCKGVVLIENCLFENMLDDGSNIHGTYMRISEIVNNNTIRVRLVHPQQWDYNFASSGDSIEFIQNKTLLPVASYRLKSVTKINEKFYEITFENDIPESVKIDDGIENISWYPKLIFRNNVVRNNRARSILISNRYKTIIENNSFSSMMSSVLFEGDMNYWHESGAVNDVVIRNNKFHDNVYGGGKGSVIWINPRLDSIVSGQYYERNIRIENNSFETFDNSILNAKSVNGLIFKNNSIVETKTYPKLNPELPAINMQNCSNIVIQGNTYQGSSKRMIDIDNQSKVTLVLDNNQKGFKVN